MPGEKSMIQGILKEYDHFVETRHWKPYINAKSIAMNLHVEAGELAEHFTWLLEEDLTSLSSKKIAAIRDEIGDVMLNVLYLADMYSIDALEATKDKLEKIKAVNPIGGTDKLKKVYLREE